MKRKNRKGVPTMKPFAVHFIASAAMFASLDVEAATPEEALKLAEAKITPEDFEFVGRGEPETESIFADSIADVDGEITLRSPSPPSPMARLLKEAIEAWPQFDGEDEVNGGDLVEWFGEFRARCRGVLYGPASTPDVRGLLKRLAMAVSDERLSSGNEAEAAAADEVLRAAVADAQMALREGMAAILEPERDGMGARLDGVGEQDDPAKTH